MKQQEVSFSQKKKQSNQLFNLSGGAGSSEGRRTGRCAGDGEEGEGGEEEEEGAGEECLRKEKLIIFTIHDSL